MKLGALYEQDETAWLQESCRIIAEKGYGKLDFRNLVDFLDSMARREKRELRSPLVQLLIHLLKWEYQPEGRCASWERTIDHQREALRALLASRTLENIAAENMAEYYERAVQRAVLEADLPAATFPKTCPFSMQSLLQED